VRVLILYATVEGQTRRIAERVAQTVRDDGAAAELVDAGVTPRPDLAGIDAAILCAPIHVGHYPDPFMQLVRGAAEALNAIPCAMISVTLAIVSDDAGERAAAEALPARLLAPTDWRPARVHHAAGALRFSEYDFFRRWVMRIIARREGHPTDGTRDEEFTDWPALERFVRDFLAAARSTS
jgi:menaquinone-dependent protoporphyrinogen oxidase